MRSHEHIRCTSAFRQAVITNWVAVPKDGAGAGECICAWVQPGGDSCSLAPADLQAYVGKRTSGRIPVLLQPATHQHSGLASPNGPAIRQQQGSCPSQHEPERVAIAPNAPLARINGQRVARGCCTRNPTQPLILHACHTRCTKSLRHHTYTIQPFHMGQGRVNTTQHTPLFAGT